MNKVILLGNLGADPVARKTKTGKSVCSFPVATDSRHLSNGAPRPPSWHSIAVFGKQADSCAQYLKKGARVLIDGTLSTSTYQSKTGETRFSVDILANAVTFLDGPKSHHCSVEPTPNDAPYEFCEEDLAM